MLILKFTLSLNSPLKANWFSGFPSGTLYRLNQSTVASRYPGLFRRTSSISASHQQEERVPKVPPACVSADVSLSYRYSWQHLGHRYWSQWPSSPFLPHQSEPAFPAPSLWWLPPESTPENWRCCVKSCRELSALPTTTTSGVPPYFLCHICQLDRCHRSIQCRRPGGWGLPTSVRGGGKTFKKWRSNCQILWEQNLPEE